MPIQEPFAYGDSLVHQIDPRLRVVMGLLYFMVAASVTRFEALVGAVFISALLVFWAKLNFAAVLKRLLWLNGFIVFLWLVLPFTVEGRTLFQVGPFTVTHPGVRLAAQITLKSNAIVLALMALTATMTIAVLGGALSDLRLPEKLVHLLLMTYRYIFVIEDEYRRLARAAKLRGFVPQTTLQTYKTYAYLIGILFVRAAARAERVYQAMQCRGFNGRFYSLYTFPKTPWNRRFAVLMGMAAFMLIWLNYGKGLI